MKALQLTIEGAYYDSQIYADHLYLWTIDGSIIIINWKKLVQSIKLEDHLTLALGCAFLRGDMFYEPTYQPLFKDQEIKQLLQRKFFDISQKEISFKKAELSKFIEREFDNPFDFPHADTNIHNGVLYVGSSEGLTSNINNRLLGTRQQQKLWDGTVLNIASWSSTLALACGSDGAFQYEIDNALTSRGGEPTLVDHHHSNTARWLRGGSIFNSSYYDGGYLAYFDEEKNEETKTYLSKGRSAQSLFEDVEGYWAYLTFEDDEPSSYASSKRRQESGEIKMPRKVRNFKELITAESLFGQWLQNDDRSSYVWGSYDKICLATSGHIEIKGYNPRKKDKLFTDLGRVKIEEVKARVVNADNAVFGCVIEYDNGMLVINSHDQSSLWLPGEPTNWRIFPQSTYYANQLHLLYENHLCVYSFNHDYFVDQAEKKAGIRYDSGSWSDTSYFIA